MKNRKKEITLLVIAILVIVSMIAGATYAFFKAQTGPAANFDINATTSTTDNLTFSTDGDIVLNVTAENLKKSGDDLSDTSIARARLIANNSSNSATAHYNVYLLIEENEMEYSSYTKEGQPNLIFMNKEKKEEANLEGYTGVPELILSVKKGETEQEITKRLTPTDGGYDITEAEGLYAIGENVEITSTSDVTDEWKVKVTFKNLEYNQQLNTGKSLKGKIIITAEKLLYEINDAAGLRQLSEEVNAGDTKEGKYYVLTNNIDLGEHQEVSNFTPIGTETNPFQGNFNGDNHTISNLYIKNSVEESRIGLFGNIKNTIISNLVVLGNISSNVTATVGGVIGGAEESVNVRNIINKVNIINVSNDWDGGGIIGGTYGNVTIKNSKNYGKVEDSTKTGGIVGFNNENLIIDNCINYGNIKGNITVNVGGLVGKSSTNTSVVKVINSHNEGTINIENNSTMITVGGIIGQSDGDINIYDSYNIGDITGNGENVIRIGGLVGYANNIAINNCYNKSTISTTNKEGNEYGSELGGIVGIVRGKGHVSNTYNLGDINGGARAGGIIGSVSNNGNALLIDKCYNLGNIKTINGSYTWHYVAGGIVATIRVNSITYIINSYNAGEVVANPTNDISYVGGLVGTAYDGNETPYKYNKIYNSYNVGNVSGKDVFINGIVYAGSENPITLNNIYNSGSIENISIHDNVYGIGYFKKNYASITNSYYSDDILGSNITGTTPMKKENMKTSSFVDTLNDNINSIDINSIKEELIASGAIDNNYDLTLSNWKLGDDGYPTLDF